MKNVREGVKKIKLRLLTRKEERNGRERGKDWKSRARGSEKKKNREREREREIRRG